MHSAAFSGAFCLQAGFQKPELTPPADDNRRPVPMYWYEPKPAAMKKISIIVCATLLYLATPGYSFAPVQHLKPASEQLLTPAQNAASEEIRTESRISEAINGLL